jgi:hypothetical protein
MIMARARFVRLLLAVLASALSACAAHPVSQAPAEDWRPSVSTPQFAPETGPRVRVDAAHGNFHTIDGRFAAFAALLRADGYRVAGADQPISSELLAGTDVFVIANAVKGGDSAEWVLPTPPALAPDEVTTLAAWVHNGGSLLLIADHMPFPGSVADLADAFGIVFLNGYAKKSASESGTLLFTQATGALADHSIVRGRNAAEQVTAIKAFTGQAFRPLVRVEPLMQMPVDWAVFFPREAGEFSDTTPLESARGLLQGAVLRHGRGRVAVFGEAAMFTAQTASNGDQVMRMGMNDPEAAQNAQFVLNVLHWLSGLLQ